MQKEGEKPSFESVEKVDTLLDEDSVRSKIKDFRTALYPRQYHPCALENPLIKRLFAYKEFFRRTCRRKNKKRLFAAKKLNFGFIDRLKGGRKALLFICLCLIDEKQFNIYDL